MNDLQMNRVEEMKKAVAITAGGNIEKRREHDFYPTPKECTVALINFLKLPTTTTIQEPACGDGYISEVFKSFGYTVFSSDINDYGYGESGIDFLKSDAIGAGAIVTNPPFNLSEKFIKKAIIEAPIVAMMLKSQYWHSKNRYSLFMNNQPSYVLPLTWRPNFAPDKGSAPTMEVYWTVWISGDNVTKYIPLLKPQNNLPKQMNLL